MDIDYGQEEQDFLKELQEKVFPIEVIPNKGLSSREQEERDLAAYVEYLGSDDFDSFYKKAFQ